MHGGENIVFSSTLAPFANDSAASRQKGMRMASSLKEGKTKKDAYQLCRFVMSAFP